MKRRSFLSASLLGTSGAILANCSKPVAKSGYVSKKAGSRIKDLAVKPPLGWNSFNSYGVYLYHEAAIANLDAMATKLKPYGYEYFVIDAGWYAEYELVSGTRYPAEKHAEKVKMNENGIYQPSDVYFKKGFKPIVDHAHVLGLKIGLHLMRGIPRKAVEMNLPVKNSNYSAKDIANVNSICAWNHHNYGVDMKKPGAQEYYDSVFRQVAEWEFDFVKVDDLNPYPDEILAIAKSIERCGRKLVYSLSPGGPVYMPDLPYYKHANMLRITTDIWDRRTDLDKAFDAWKRFQGIAHEGFWPDLDMIPFGMLQLMSPAKFGEESNTVDLAGLGNTRQSDLSPAQMRTFITIRAMAASPLFMGGDLLSLDEYSLSLITNAEMLACNQNGECAFNVHNEDGIEVWICNQKDATEHGWIGIFNRNEVTKEVNLSRKELGLMKFIENYQLAPSDTNFVFKNIWNNESLLFDKDNFTKSIEGDDVAFFKFSNAQALS